MHPWAGTSRTVTAMTDSRFTVRLDGTGLPSRDLVGGKAWSIARMLSLGLRVPPAFVLTTEAYRAFDQQGDFTPAMLDELMQGVRWLEEQTGRSFGGGSRPLLVSVRSGSAVSMPGMMDTVLNLGITDQTESALAVESEDPIFARDTHLRFLESFTETVLKVVPPAVGRDHTPARWRDAVEKNCGVAIPADPFQQLRSACRAVFESWHSRRARRYRKHQGIPDDLGTAVTIQAMVFGNLDDRSGTGVLFSRNPLTGTREVYGEYLRRAQGEDVVSGKVTPEPLTAVASRDADLYQEIVSAAGALEAANKEVQDIEFTVQHGTLYLLQSRTAKLAPAAAIRTSLDLVREGVLDASAALLRITPDQVRSVLAPRLHRDAAASTPIATGEGSCPGVGIGIVVCDSDEAERRAAAGEKVVLARPTTSPSDIDGMLAAVAVITEEGGSTSHAAVVSRALGLPCVVGCGNGVLSALAGRLVTVDGGTGRVFPGSLPLDVPDQTVMSDLRTIEDWARERSRIAVVDQAEPGQELLDLNTVEDGSDSERIESVLKSHPHPEGVGGGAITSQTGIRAAIEAGFHFILARPVLPTLLAAAQISITTFNGKDGP